MWLRRRKAYLFSFALWQMISTEKLNARAYATASQIDSLYTKERIIITKQNKLTITVKAFFSDKYLRINYWI